MNIHDKEIIGLLYKKNDKSLILFSLDGNDLLFESVAFFHFNNISEQNIIFDIYTWEKDGIPNEIIETFPCISPFLESKETYNFHYINPSVGLEGIVITQSKS